MMMLWLTAALAAIPGTRGHWAHSPTDTSASKYAEARCPAGWYAISGGGSLTGLSDGAQVSWVGPGPAARSWSIRADAPYGWVEGNWGVVAYVTCASPALWSQFTVVRVNGRASSLRTDDVATCPAGTEVVSGGVQISPAVGGAHVLLASTPDQTTGWRVSFLDGNAAGGSAYELTAMCVPSRLWTARITQSTITSGAGDDYQFIFDTCPAGYDSVSAGFELTGPEAEAAVLYGVIGTSTDAAVHASARGVPPTAMDWEVWLTNTCYRR